ncbi:hypothetical protein F131LOC_010595 [Pectobacterium versatile]|uniref:Uncharacterized protein n=1 Tax=Pectobacterium versatile TaxID=2488639 RepID=A0A7T0HHR1_9GAMM|nr:hypothetical protein F131LOC_010595 [Pectobacterium versatile]
MVINMPPTYSQNKSSVSLNYRESKSLFISLFTALENACKYGDKSKPVKLLHSLHGEYEKLEIVNSTINMDKEYADELISREKSKWNDDF